MDCRKFAPLLLVVVVTACTRSPAQRAKDALVSALRVAVPQATIDASQSDVVKVSWDNTSGTLGLESGTRICTSVAACDEWASSTAANLVASAKLPRPTPETLRVVLKPRSWTREVRERAPDAGVTTRPFSSELELVLMHDLPESTLVVTARGLASLSMSEDEAIARGLANLDGADEPWRPLEPGSGPSVFVSDVDDGYDAARLLVAARWEPLSARVKGQLLAIASNRDVVFLTGSEEPGGVDAIRALAARSHETVSHPLSLELLRWEPSGWVVAGAH